MKKVIITLAAVAMLATSASAQSTVTLNSRAWSNNYWTTILYNIAQGLVVSTLGADNHVDSVALACILPGADLVFPVGMAKSGFENIGLPTMTLSVFPSRRWVTSASVSMPPGHPPL